MKERVWIIYKIVAVNGRAYVGVTKRTMSERWNEHLRAARIGAVGALYNAIRKYGRSYFSMYELTRCFSDHEARVCERAMIATHRTFVRGGNGFNLTLGGEGNWGWKPTEETLANQRAAAKRRLKNDPGHPARMVAARGPSKFKGIPKSAEHRAKIAATLKGRAPSKETRKKIAAAGIGRKHSEEAKRKIGIGNKGKYISPETRERVSQSKTGKPYPEEGKKSLRLHTIWTRAMKQRRIAAFHSLDLITQGVLL